MFPRTTSLLCPDQSSDQFVRQVAVHYEKSHTGVVGIVSWWSGGGLECFLVDRSV